MGMVLFPGVRMRLESVVVPIRVESRKLLNVTLPWWGGVSCLECLSFLDLVC